MAKNPTKPHNYTGYEPPMGALTPRMTRDRQGPQAVTQLVRKSRKGLVYFEGKR